MGWMHYTLTLPISNKKASGLSADKRTTATACANTQNVPEGSGAPLLCASRKGEALSTSGMSEQSMNERVGVLDDEVGLGAGHFVTGRLNCRIIRPCRHNPQ